MDLNRYQELAARTIPTDKEQKMKLAEFAVGINEEAGEASGVVKKVVFHNHPFTREKKEKLIEELGDVLWHIAAIAKEYNINLSYIAIHNIKKLKKRYPNGFSTTDSIRRVDTEND